MGMMALLIARALRKPVFVSIDTDRARIGQLRYGKTTIGRLKALALRAYVNGLLVLFGGGRPAFVTGGSFLGERPRWKQWVKSTVTSAELPQLRPASFEKIKCPNVLFVGRLEPEKNVVCLIRAVRLLQDMGRETRLTVVGQGSERKLLEPECSSLAQGTYRFLEHVGHSELLATRMAGADILVLPSREERQGKVLLEAMACSVPVVAARAGGIPSVIHDGHTGLLFNPDSVSELADCIAKLADDAQLRSKLVDNGYYFAQENTIDRSVAAIMSDVLSFYGLEVRASS